MGSDQVQALLARLRALALPIGAGIFLILYGAVGLFYIQEVRQQEDTSAEILQLDALLRMPREPLAELQQRSQGAVDAIPTKIVADQDVFPVIRELAAESGVQVISQKKNAGSTTVKVGQKTYTALSFNVLVRGEYLRLLHYVESLELQQRLATLVVRSTSITNSGEVSEGNISFEVLVRS